MLEDFKKHFTDCEILNDIAIETYDRSKENEPYDILKDSRLDRYLKHATSKEIIGYIEKVYWKHRVHRVYFKLYPSNC